MGTKNKPGDFDCYAAAQPDEPMFILLGRDPLAGALVREWVLMRRLLLNEPFNAMQDAQLSGTGHKKLDEALRCADDLDAWCRKLGREPAPAPASFAQALQWNRGTPDGWMDLPATGECIVYGHAMLAVRLRALLIETASEEDTLEVAITLQSAQTILLERVPVSAFAQGQMLRNTPLMPPGAMATLTFHFPQKPKVMTHRLRVALVGATDWIEGEDPVITALRSL